MTNREWLESLTDEEMAKYLTIVAMYGNDFTAISLIEIFVTATNAMEYEYAPEYTDWLKAEHKEVTK